MLRRIPVSVIAVYGRQCSSVAGSSPYSGDVSGATGKDNTAGVYATKRPTAYFEAARQNPNPAKIRGDHEPNDRSDNLQYPEYDLIDGKFENAPPHITGGPGAMRYNKFVREEGKETVEYNDVMPQPPHVGHHKDFEYLSNTGKRENNISNQANSIANWDIKSAVFSLYRCCLRGLPILKHGYWLMMPLDKMKDKVRHRFEINRFVRDPDAVRHLLHNGWMEYQDSITFRRTRTSLHKYFDQYDDRDVLREHYTKEEGQLLEERKFWNGEQQKSEGPYSGQWSALGRDIAEEFERIAGRVPKSWSASKGYFEMGKPDGTNYWEKNLDYEGWYLKNVDPDTSNARQEAQGWVESGLNQPKHYASKNRRAYRRFVKDIEQIMESSMEEVYTRNREVYFQQEIRSLHPESNRVAAEKTLTLKDDDVYSTRWEETDKCVKQVMREMPNPRLWRTDAFYFRYRQLTAHLEYNWARIPIGTEQEKLYSEWISDDVNYAVLNSKTFATVKANKKQNPMAASWADFYEAFDPDVTATRQLPWFHADFDYDRRHKWDERCMRKKKWLQTGDIDFKNSFFDSYVAQWEQRVNRSDLIRLEATEDKYVAPRMVQLYRAMNRLMDVALANQLKEFVAPKIKGCAGEKLSDVLDKVDVKDFTFVPPTLIFPDGQEQVRLALDGSMA